jgi:type IX secretion system PorP/SprF family membrane protein
MKKLIYVSLLLLIPIGIYGQQFPFMEGYNVNPYSMSPAFAGLKNIKTLFIDYRSDWTGVNGGPQTYQLSYNDRAFERVGLGGSFIYDKTDIFKQTLLMGTYSYEIKVAEGHLLNLGLSVGFYRNSIDLAKYFNNPTYVQDNVLIYGLQKSKMKFATDLSALYRFRNFEGGILLSNVMFGSARYNSSDIAYKPTKNFLVHGSMDFKIGENWGIKPFVLVRGGQHYPTQLELASQVNYLQKLWGTAVFRTGGIWGLGFGGEVYKGFLLNYSYNLSSNVSLNAFGSHQITLGIRIFELSKILNKSDRTQK